MMTIMPYEFISGIIPCHEKSKLISALYVKIYVNGTLMNHTYMK